MDNNFVLVSCADRVGMTAVGVKAPVLLGGVAASLVSKVPSSDASKMPSSSAAAFLFFASSSFK